MDVTGSKVALAWVGAAWLALLTAGCGNMICDPPRAENLTAVPESPHSITIFWDGPAYDYCAGDCTVDYDVYRNGVLVGSGLWQYEDRGLEPATLYCYVIRSSYGYCEYCDDYYVYENGEAECSEFLSSLVWLNLEERRAGPVCVETYPLRSISGRVSSGGSGVEDIAIDLVAIFPFGGSRTTLTDAAGNYLFTDLENGSYLVTPAGSGFTFIPESWEVLIYNADISGLDFEM